MAQKGSPPFWQLSVTISILGIEESLLVFHHITTGEAQEEQLADNTIECPAEMLERQEHLGTADGLIH